MPKLAESIWRVTSFGGMVNWGEIQVGGKAQPGAKVSVYWRSHGETVKMVSAGAFINARLAAKSFHDAAQVDRQIAALALPSNNSVQPGLD